MKQQSINMMRQFITAIALISFMSLSARERQGGGSSSTGGDNGKLSGAEKVMDVCKAGTGSRELWVNNVRTIIFTGGDMWWDLFGSGNPFYGVPGVQDKSLMISSSFAGSIWIGGLDAGGQLKVAAMTYRQNGNDFWPGPLDTSSVATDETVCNAYDKIFSISRKEVEDAYYNGVISSDVKNWPAHPLDPAANHAFFLAPFVDVDGDNKYDPSAKDYAAYDLFNKAEKDQVGACKAKLFGDATLWWVFNDKGDIHTETSGQSIGLEVRAQAFGFKTSDEINNMTFYSYEVINRSTFTLNKTYFTVWTDADLGCYTDDYVGCDISRGLGFIYNSDAYDEDCGSLGYKDYPAAFGCDFFRGPIADINDLKDNDFDGQVDEAGETIGMAKFLYYNNNIGSFAPQTTNPDLASHYYGYMTGFWKDGSPFTFGGNAYGGSTPVDYVYDGDPYLGTGWTETSAGNDDGDRRFLQSAGPFTLKPGAVNNVTFGLPWAQSPLKGGNLVAINLLKIADDKAQALFNDCFKILDGPEAPDLTIQEGNKELLIYLTNQPSSNNYLNTYKEKDVTILSPGPQYTATCLKNPDQFYRFEGYKVYQLRDNQVSQTDLEDITKAKLVFQADIENGVSRLVNYIYDGSVGANVPKVKVDGADNGITSTFKVTRDEFAPGDDKNLVNNKTYYFMAVAYAYNSFAEYRPDTDPLTSECANYLGQKKPYLEGRKIKKGAGIPHLTDIEKGGTTTQSSYGYGPKVTRIEGQGNGGNILDLTAESTNQILATGMALNPTYENGRGPINIKVVDPLNVPNSTFEVRFMRYPTPAVVTSVTPVFSTVTPLPWDSASVVRNASVAATPKSDSTTWVLKDLGTGETYQANKSIKIGEEYYFSKLGLSVNIQQVADPANAVVTHTIGQYNTGDFLEGTMTFADPLRQWLTGLTDDDNPAPTNWIRCGSATVSPTEYNPNLGSASSEYIDPDKVFGNILNATWAPYCLVGGTTKNSPAQPGYFGSFQNGITDNTKPGDVDPRFITSVDIVFTPDQSKWTRCPVLEMQNDSILAEGRQRFFFMRRHASVDKNGVATTNTASASTDPNDANYISGTGMGWFPGYAINLETGERMNMAFGEDSYNFKDNGNDMLWNPTSQFNNPEYPNAFGGRHYIYVFGNNKVDYYTTNFTGTAFTLLAPLGGTPLGTGRYDGGLRMVTQLKMAEQIYNKAGVTPQQITAGSWAMKSVIRDAQWVNIPLINPAYSIGAAFKNPKDMPSEVKVRLRVKKAYRYGYATEWARRIKLTSANYVGNQSNNNNWLTTSTYTTLPIDTVVPKASNFNMPLYQFNTSDIYTMYSDADVAKNALDYVRVVPNPYYAYSSYESKRIDTRVRITNLPSLCTIKIYTMNGTLVRTFKRDVSGQEDEVTTVNDVRQSKRTPYLDWDLKNQSGIPIASGLYIIHIDAGEIGEKILKWFGVMRPLDLQNY